MSSSLLLLFILCVAKVENFQINSFSTIEYITENYIYNRENGVRSTLRRGDIGFEIIIWVFFS